MKNPRWFVNLLMLGWLAIFTTLVHAQSDSYARDVLGIDWLSVLLACATGLAGGMLRTIMTLASGRFLVIDELKVARRDWVIAILGGAIVYGVIQALAAFGWVVPRDARIIIIAAAGFSRGGWLPVIKRGSASLLDRGEAMLRGGTPPTDPPPSAAMPLEPQK